MQVGAVALEELVRRDRQEDVEVARRAAADPGLALAGKPDAGAVLDPWRDVDRKRALARHAPGAGAGRARILDHLAAALADRAGALEREEAALGVADAAVAVAVLAGLRLGARLGAGAGAGLAGDRGRQPQLGGLAGERLLQRDLHVEAKIGAALAPAAARAARARHAEDAFENVGEGGAEVAAEAVRAAHAALLERGVAEAIVGCALLLVLQDVVGFVDFLEALLAILVAWIAVRVMLHGELAVRGLHLGLARRRA